MGPFLISMKCLILPCINNRRVIIIGAYFIASLCLKYPIATVGLYCMGWVVLNYFINNVNQNLEQDWNHSPYRKKLSVL